MANSEQLEILKSGVDNWNKWRNENPGIRPYLTWADLSNENLIGANLMYANLGNANLKGANLSHANLSRTIINGVKLENTRLVGTKLIGANLAGVRLNEIIQQAANLSEADLSGTQFIKSNLMNANLSRAILTTTDLSFANLTGADLAGAQFLDANLSNANLTMARLFNTCFVRTDLSNTNFKDTKISSAVWSLTDLSTCTGLETVNVYFNCSIDFQTLSASRNLPKSFLLKLGLPELYIDYLPDFYSDSLTYYPVFLSHSKENKEFARKLYEALIARGVNVFFDEKKLKPGDSLFKTIRQGIHLYDKTIVVCSKESLASKWVDYELELLLKKELSLIEQEGNEDIGLLIPITIDDHIFSWKGPKEWDIKNRFIGDFKKWQDEQKFEDALKELIQALNVNRPFILPHSHFKK